MFLRLAGPVLYARLGRAEPLAARPPRCALGLFQGIQHESPSSEAPFGRDFKLFLLRNTRSFHFAVTASLQDVHIEKCKDLLGMLKGLPSDVCLFPRLVSLTLGPHRVPDVPCQAVLAQIGTAIASRSVAKEVRIWQAHGMPTNGPAVTNELTFFANTALHSLTTFCEGMRSLPHVCPGIASHRVVFPQGSIAGVMSVKGRVEYLVQMIQRQPDIQWIIKDVGITMGWTAFGPEPDPRIWEEVELRLRDRLPGVSLSFE